MGNTCGISQGTVLEIECIKKKKKKNECIIFQDLSFKLFLVLESESWTSHIVQGFLLESLNDA